MPIRAKNHYDALGVAQDATPDQIKRAYRSKARTHHPDKGGDAQEFASAAAAYDVLSDPQRRQLYDATGQDRETPIEEEANRVLLGLFNEMVSSAPEGRILDCIRLHLDELTRSFKDNKAQIKVRQGLLKKRREKITSTSETNLAHLVIDKEMQSIDHAFADLDRKIAVTSACKRILNTYSEEKQKMIPPISDGFYFKFNFDAGGGVNG